MSSTTLAVIEAFTTRQPVKVGAMTRKELSELLRGINEALSREG